MPESSYLQLWDSESFCFAFSTLVLGSEKSFKYINGIDVLQV